MVKLHIKHSDLNQYIYETNCQIKVEDLNNDLIEINNLRIKLDRLCQSLEGLADHGVLRPEALRGLTTPETYNPAVDTLKGEEINYSNMKPNNNQRVNEDKTGFRVGIAPLLEVSKKIKDEIIIQKQLLHKNLVDQRKAITKDQLENAMNMLKGCVMIAYPAYHGLPKWDNVYMILENTLDYNFQYPDSGYYDSNDISLWWAGKELTKNKKLYEFIGKNEKTKVIIKIQKKGAGAPVREPPIDQETHKKMLAYYHKKQENLKELDNNNEDDFLNSAWANPNNLKNQLFNGNKNISWKPQ